MPLFNVQLRKAINTGGLAYKWSNRYFCNQPSAEGALDWGLGLWNTVERLMHVDLAFCYEVYVNQVGDAPYTPGEITAVPAGVQRGTRVSTGGDVDKVLPSFNVLRVDFPVRGSRPSRKFYRLPLLEDDVFRGSLLPAFVTALGTGLGGFFDITVVDVDGQLWGGDYVIRGVTSHRLGRDAFVGVPTGPAFG